MSNLQIDSVLAQIRALSQQAQGVKPAGAGGVTAPASLAPGAQGAAGAGGTSFANVLKSSVQEVNATQQRASQLAVAFEKGTPGVELSQVMLEMQKANVSFRAVTEVRNRLVNAYQEIMNMPI